MRRISILLVMALLLSLSPAVQAEGGVSIEVMIVDGMSVVMLTPEETLFSANETFRKGMSKGSTVKEHFVLPAFLTLIEESAFEGISARRVEISEKVVAIERRAFADCKGLREIHIPATVLKVDDLALEGCEKVTVYGTAGTEAERFAKAAGFDFVDPNGAGHPAEPPIGERMDPPVVLPFVRK